MATTMASPPSSSLAAAFAFCLLMALVTSAAAADLPQSWPRCRRKDPNLDYCLQSAITLTMPQLATAIPALDFPGLEPVSLDEDFTLDKRPGRVSLEIKLSNIKSHGLSNMRILSVYTDVENGIIDMFFHQPLSAMHGDMEVEGKIMHEPVSPQKGGANFTFAGAEGFITLSGSQVEREGQTYLEMQDASVAVLNLGGLGVHFDQLDSSPERSAKLNYLLNANSLALWPSLRDHLSNQHSKGIVEIANRIFSKVPMKEIFLADDHPAVLAGPVTFVFP